MASSKEVGTAAATQQLGSMSLGESAERKDNDTTTAENGTNPTKKLCSACGKKSDTVKKCNGCKCVWYCDKECQNKHRREHKKECRRIKKELDKRGGRLDLGTEEDVGPLGKLPPREECPICMQVFPLHVALQGYFTCCGKTLCCGCSYQHEIKSGELAAERGKKTAPLTCAFCREPVPTSDKELLAGLRKRVERKDPVAMHSIAMHYRRGELGLPVDQAKCIDLLRESAGLGFLVAQHHLGNFYRNGELGLEQDEEEGFKYEKKAADSGHLISRNNLGCVEEENGDDNAAICHWRLSASGGLRGSMEALIGYFEFGLLHHGDLAETLQAFYFARAEMRSKDRNQFIEHLKKTGEYREEYDE